MGEERKKRPTLGRGGQKGKTKVDLASTCKISLPSAPREGGERFRSRGRGGFSYPPSLLLLRIAKQGELERSSTFFKLKGGRKKGTMLCKGSRGREGRQKLVQIDKPARGKRIRTLSIRAETTRGGRKRGKREGDKAECGKEQPKTTRNGLGLYLWRVIGSHREEETK